jgi:hypothetical protein
MQQSNQVPLAEPPGRNGLINYPFRQRRLSASISPEIEISSSSYIKIVALHWKNVYYVYCELVSFVKGDNTNTKLTLCPLYFSIQMR